MNILLVEDNESEQVIIKEAFQEAGQKHHLEIAGDGHQALALLNNHNGTFKPDLIILDLNMPGKNGFDVLTGIRENLRWKHVPVLAFSNSEFPGDVCKCYAMGANAYLNKPSDFQSFIDLANIIDVFWFKLARHCHH